MYIVKTKFIRPSRDVPYFIDAQPQLKADFAVFLENNKGFISEFDKRDETELIQTTAVAYHTESAFNAFMELFSEKFPSFFSDRDNYCSINNIIIERTNVVI